MNVDREIDAFYAAQEKRFAAEANRASGESVQSQIKPGKYSRRLAERRQDLIDMIAPRTNGIVIPEAPMTNNFYNPGIEDPKFSGSGNGGKHPNF